MSGRLKLSYLLKIQDGLTEEQLIVFKQQADDQSASDADRLLNDLIEYKKRVVQDVILSKHYNDVEIAIVEVGKFEVGRITYTLQETETKSLEKTRKFE